MNDQAGVEAERLRADAELVRQRQERTRQINESARNSAEEARVRAEEARDVALDSIRKAIAELSAVLDRMHSVEAMRREAHKTDREP